MAGGVQHQVRHRLPDERGLARDDGSQGDGGVDASGREFRSGGFADALCDARNASGSSSTTSSRVWVVATGVRSSWEAFAATRSHIRRQFLVEALLLSALGAAGGVALGSAATAVLALANGWPVAIPPALLATAAAAALAIGAAAGLYPAIRAARTPPVTALTG